MGRCEGAWAGGVGRDGRRRCEWERGGRGGGRWKGDVGLMGWDGKGYLDVGFAELE